MRLATSNVISYSKSMSLVLYIMKVSSGLNPRAIRSRAFSYDHLFVSLRSRSSLTRYFSSSVIWKYKRVLNFCCMCNVKIHGTRCPICTGPDGPLPV